MLEERNDHSGTENADGLELKGTTALPPVILEQGEVGTYSQDSKASYKRSKKWREQSKYERKPKGFALGGTAWPSLDEAGVAEKPRNSEQVIKKKSKNQANSSTHGTRKKQVNWVSMPLEAPRSKYSKGRRKFRSKNPYHSKPHQSSRRYGHSNSPSLSPSSSIAPTLDSAPAGNFETNLTYPQVPFYPQEYYYDPYYSIPQYHFDEHTVNTFVMEQVEYYFSVDNLCKDTYLRGRMDDQGYVSLELVSGFRRLQTLTNDWRVIATAIQGSSFLELSDDQTKVRRKNDWQDFLLPQNSVFKQTSPPPSTEMEIEEKPDPISIREESEATKSEAPVPSTTTITKESISSAPIPSDPAPPTQPKPIASPKTDPPTQVTSPSTVAKSNPKQTIQPSKSKSTSKSKPSKSSRSLPADTPPVKKSPAPQSSFTPPSHIQRGGQKKVEYVGDWQMAPSRRKKRNDPKKKKSDKAAHRHPYKKAHGKTNPTSSTLFTDSLLLFTADPAKVSDPSLNDVFQSFYPSKAKQGKDSGQTPRFYPVKGKRMESKYHVGWVLPPVDADPQLMPSFAPLLEKGFTKTNFVELRQRSHADQDQTGYGKSVWMNTFVRFLGHFLVDHFDKRKYIELKEIAIKENENNVHYGMECLFRFYLAFLVRSFRYDVFKDFARMVKLDVKSGYCYGLEKLWIFLRKRQSKRKLKLDDQVRGWLNERQTLEDFQRDNRKMSNISSAKKVPLNSAPVTTWASIAKDHTQTTDKT